MRDKIHEHSEGQGPWRGGQVGHGPWGGGQHGPHARGRRSGHGPNRDWQDFFGGEGGWPFGDRFGGLGGPGAGRERLERGLLRHVILSVLKDGPKHGYEIIKHLEEHTRGRYSPSPGTLYPTLQYLEDLGLVRSDQEADKRVYHLTESGQAELNKQSTMVEGFWSRFQDRTPPGANLHELKFAGDALKDLLRTVGSGLRSGTFAQDTESVRKIRQSLERCQNEVREIIAGSATHSGDRTSPEHAEPRTAAEPRPNDERYL